MVLDADNSHTILDASAVVTDMTNQELQIEVAKAVGWSNLQLGNVYGEDDLDGQGIYGEPFSNYQLERWSAAGGNLADRLLCEGRLIGTPPSSGGFMPVPNWPNDLPACMAPGGPWEWLWSKITRWGVGDVMGIRTSEVGTSTFWIWLDEVVEVNAKTFSQAICHAVLAVKEKLDA